MTNPADVQLIEATKPQPKPFCIIPARKGSKRIKNKNKKLLLDKPLVDYAIKAAIDSDIFALIVVSSDDNDILELAYSYFGTNVIQPHKRQSVLCKDDSPIKVVVRYVIQSYLMGEEVCLLQPTNPLITTNQIKDAYKVFKEKDPNYLIGMCKEKDIGFHFFKKSIFLKEYDKDFYGTNWIPYEMEGIDIDTEEDWIEAERIMEARNKQNWCL